MKSITNNELDNVLKEYPISHEKEMNKILSLKQNPNGEIYITVSGVTMKDIVMEEELF